MRLPDGSILMHADGQPYDATKAHEYYLRTRKLHPRQHQTTYTVIDSKGKSSKITPKQLAEQKANTAQRITHIKQNLHNLEILLKDKMQKAKAAQAKAAKPPTLAEKAKAAEDAQKYRASHKTEIAAKAKAAASKSGSSTSKSKSSAAKTDTVESLKKDISATKANLKAAVAKQRELATAKKNG